MSHYQVIVLLLVIVVAAVEQTCGGSRGKLEGKKRGRKGGKLDIVKYWMGKWVGGAAISWTGRLGGGYSQQ